VYVRVRVSLRALSCVHICMGVHLCVYARMCACVCVFGGGPTCARRSVVVVVRLDGSGSTGGATPTERSGS
jgi:hypothetical protein